MEESCPERVLAIDGTVVSMANVENSLQIILLVLMGVPTNVFQGGGRQFARLPRKLPDLFCN